MPRLPNTWGVMIIHFAILVCCHCQVNKTIRLACQYAIHFGKEILIMHFAFVCLCLRAAVPASCLVLYSLQLKQLNAVAEEPLEVTVARGNYAINFYANNQPMPRVKMTQGVMLIQDAILACCHRQVSMKTSETLGHKDPLSKNEKSHNPLLGQRIGEASHPVPRCKMDDNQNAVLAILNPTAIRNKEKEFSCLMKVYNVDTFCCAETTATKETQDMMTKKLHELQLKTVWSDPVVQQRQRVNGQPCARGRAGGTSVHSKWPIRPACSHEHKPLCAADRVTHAIVRWGTMYVQIITIYGYTGGNAWHKKATNELFERAIKMSHTTNMPTLFVGDFNMDVHDLEQFDSLRSKGYMSLQMLHEMHLGAPLPPTCKGATTPDTALVPPELCQRIKAIHVDAQCLFDAHAPVIVIFDVPKQDLFHMRMKTPKTWTEIPLDKQVCNQTHSWNGLSLLKKLLMLPSKMNTEVIPTWLHLRISPNDIKVAVKSLSLSKFPMSSLSKKPEMVILIPLWKLQAIKQSIWLSRFEDFNHCKKDSNLWPKLKMYGFKLRLACGKNGMPFVDGDKTASLSYSGRKTFLNFFHFRLSCLLLSGLIFADNSWSMHLNKFNSKNPR